jgi:predicted kinase
MHTPWLLFTCGYPFSGKSTLAKAVADTFDLALVAVDDQLERGPSSVPPVSGQELDWLRAYRTALEATAAALGSGKSVIFDSVGHTRKNRQRLRRLAERVPARPLLIWLDLSPAEARARLQRNDSAPVRQQVPIESFERIVDEFEAPTPDEPLVRYRPEIDMRAWIETTLRPALNR